MADDDTVTVVLNRDDLPVLLDALKFAWNHDEITDDQYHSLAEHLADHAAGTENGV